MDFSNILFRASGNGYIMVPPKSKEEKAKGNLGEGAKTHLVDIYVSEKYNRQTDITNKYMAKGMMVEEDSITLYSRLKKKYFKKNDLHLANHYIKGTPDLFTGPDIHHAEEIIDVKSSWDIYTFFRTHTKDINNIYYWQLQSYMALTGAKKATLAYCLINTPDILIGDEKRKLLYKMGAVSQESKEFNEACEELERSMTYDDIPLNERMIEYSIQRNDEDIELLYAKVEKCREYLNELDRIIHPSVVMANYDSEIKATVLEKINIPLIKLK